MAIPPIPYLPSILERIHLIHGILGPSQEIPLDALSKTLEVIFAADPLPTLAQGAILQLVQEKADIAWDYDVLKEWLSRIHDEHLAEIYANGVEDGIAFQRSKTKAKRESKPEWKKAASFKTIQALKCPAARQARG